MGEDGDVPRGSRAYARRAVEASLRRLRTDVIDLYYLHEPDGVTPLAESIGALAELADEGKIRTFGVSNLDAAQLREVVASGDERLVALQNEYNLLEREDEAEVLPLRARARASATSRTSRSPAGVLTGKFRRGEAPPEGTRMAARAERLTDAAVRPRRGARGVRRRARAQPARAGVRRARLPAGHPVRDRRRDAPRAGRRATSRPASGSSPTPTCDALAEV